MRRLLPLLVVLLAAAPAWGVTTVNTNGTAAPPGRIITSATYGTMTVTGSSSPYTVTATNTGHFTAGALVGQFFQDTAGNDFIITSNTISALMVTPLPTSSSKPQTSTVSFIVAPVFRQFYPTMRLVSNVQKMPVPPMLTFLERAIRTDTNATIHWSVTGYVDLTGIGSGVSTALLTAIRVLKVLYTPVGQQ